MTDIEVALLLVQKDRPRTDLEGLGPLRNLLQTQSWYKRIFSRDLIIIGAYCFIMKSCYVNCCTYLFL